MPVITIQPFLGNTSQNLSFTSSSAVPMTSLFTGGSTVFASSDIPTMTRLSNGTGDTFASTTAGPMVTVFKR